MPLNKETKPNFLLIKLTCTEIISIVLELLKLYNCKTSYLKPYNCA